MDNLFFLKYVEIVNGAMVSLLSNEQVWLNSHENSHQKVMWLSLYDYMFYFMNQIDNKDIAKS